jgi:hypothetical protein
MPRKSSASRAFKVHSTPERLAPPAGLTTAESRIWTGIVADRRPEHFTVSDMPLLAAYTHACAMEATLARQIGKNIQPDSTLVARRERATRAMVLLSMRLRLSPQQSPNADASGRATWLGRTRGNADR